jgi:hypothetical protein
MPGRNSTRAAPGSRPLGRPKNVTLAEADLTIALTVQQLLMWGFPLRGRNGVRAVVAQLAQDVLRRLGHSGAHPQPLSDERVEQIFKRWRKKERDRRKNTTEWPLEERYRYTAQSLARDRPDHRRGLRHYARKLLQNGGKWPWEHIPDEFNYSRAQLSLKAHKEYLLMPRFRPR